MWAIFIVGEHGTGKSTVATKLASVLQDVMSHFGGITTGVVEVSDAVRGWQDSIGNVEHEAVYGTELQSAELHRQLWYEWITHDIDVVSGARELHLLYPPREMQPLVRTASYGLLLDEVTRKKRWMQRELISEDVATLEEKWRTVEARSKEMGVRDLAFACDHPILLNLQMDVDDVVSVILTTLLHYLKMKRSILA